MNNNITEEIFFKKIYTFAFRLTGSEKSACILVEKAINKKIPPLGLHKNLSENFFKCIAKDICHIYIYNSELFIDETDEENEEKENVNMLQKSLLTLEPLNRVTIVWKDVYGFRLDEFVPAVKQQYNILQQVLAETRRQLKIQLLKG